MTNVTHMVDARSFSRLMTLGELREDRNLLEDRLELGIAYDRLSRLVQLAFYNAAIAWKIYHGEEAT